MTVKENLEHSLARLRAVIEAMSLMDDCDEAPARERVIALISARMGIEEALEALPPEHAHARYDLHFEGYWRDWYPIRGYEEGCPEGKIFEMRCVDTDTVVVGGTMEEAFQRLLLAKEAEKRHREKDKE
jgi:hypothetical protein